MCFEFELSLESTRNSWNVTRATISTNLSQSLNFTKVKKPILLFLPAGPQCEWSGCIEFKPLVELINRRCTTGITGGLGRTDWHKSDKCGFLKLGGRDFCCEPQCRYEQCGKTCASLQKYSWAHEMPTKMCILDIPGYGPVPSWEEFCCPSP